MYPDFIEKYNAVRDEAKIIAGHPVKVIAVTKNFPLQLMEDCLHHGIYSIGENKIQEAKDKFEKLDVVLRGKLEFHFIGALQSNKARFVPGVFQYVHGIGTGSALLKLEEACKALPEKLKILLQFNISREKSKSGFSPDDTGVIADILSGCENVEPCGLMTIGPLEGSQDDTRAVFRDLRKIRDDMNKKYGLSLTELSMGMSDDYRVACEEGATMIRLGSILFGARPGK